MNICVPRLLCGVALCVLSVTQARAETSPSAPTEAAHPAEAKGTAKKDGIVVTTTAQKRFENIQNVPLAVQVISPPNWTRTACATSRNWARSAPRW
ncbi:hypothetical protein GCM10020258_33600 [Sphingomonas yabuuchiae]